jgi:hypothetical protein
MTGHRETWAVTKPVIRIAEEPSAQGVRAPIVAKKPVNAGGAKGCREVETR